MHARSEVVFLALPPELFHSHQSCAPCTTSVQRLPRNMFQSLLETNSSLKGGYLIEGFPSISIHFFLLRICCFQFLFREKPFQLPSNSVPSKSLNHIQKWTLQKATIFTPQSLTYSLKNGAWKTSLSCWETITLQGFLLFNFGRVFMEMQITSLHGILSSSSILTPL